MKFVQSIEGVMLITAGERGESRCLPNQGAIGRQRVREVPALLIRTREPPTSFTQPGRIGIGINKSLKECTREGVALLRKGTIGRLKEPRLSIQCRIDTRRGRWHRRRKPGLQSGATRKYQEQHARKPSDNIRATMNGNKHSRSHLPTGVPIRPYPFRERNIQSR